ncbi:hypothetical protein FQR65_LT04174 [Abscondita terminalis]|nr:hypothetical protein FQR65_LT04174 [Abscondita terminalis]
MFEVFRVIILLVYVLIITDKSQSTNVTELITTYSKVSRWGSNGTSNSASEARSHGQNPWLQRINAAKYSAPLRQPVYYHTMKASKFDNDNVDNVPAKGEVEERFNPRPYFDFVFDDNPKPNKPSSQSSQKQPAKQPTIVYSAPVDFPLSKPPVDAISSAQTPADFPLSKLPIDAYSSPFSSYNPPNSNGDDSKPLESNPFNYPPNNNNPFQETLPSTSKRPEKKPHSTSYEVPDMQIPKPAPETDIISSYNQYLPPNSDGINKPYTSTHKPNQSYMVVSSDEDLYSESISGYDHLMMQSTRRPSKPKPTRSELPSKYHASLTGSMAEDDLSPPPEDMSFGKFPQYLDHDPHDHSFYHHHHDHDIYHEVHTTTAATTTSTEVPRAGHYSYYYLGRKLWYIPLYFSVYFIVYVTVLILKSIARHKIQFSHYFDKGRSARQLNVDVLNQTIITAIEKTKNKYM